MIDIGWERNDSFHILGHRRTTGVGLRAVQIVRGQGNRFMGHPDAYAYLGEPIQGENCKMIRSWNRDRGRDRSNRLVSLPPPTFIFQDGMDN